MVYQTNALKQLVLKYENKTAAVKLGNEVISWSRIKSGVKEAVFYPPLYGLS